MLSSTKSTLEVRQRMVYGFNLRLSVDNLEEAASAVSERGQVTAAVSEKSAAVDKALKYVTYLYKE